VIGRSFIGQAVLHRPAGQRVGERLQPLWTAERAGIADAELSVGANLPGVVAGVEVGERARDRFALCWVPTQVVVDLFNRVGAAPTGRVKQSVQQQAGHLQRRETRPAGRGQQR
jgi:hypothetical protein